MITCRHFTASQQDQLLITLRMFPKGLVADLIQAEIALCWVDLECKAIAQQIDLEDYDAAHERILVLDHLIHSLPLSDPLSVWNPFGFAIQVELVGLGAHIDTVLFFDEDDDEGTEASDDPTMVVEVQSFGADGKAIAAEREQILMPWAGAESNFEAIVQQHYDPALHVRQDDPLRVGIRRTTLKWMDDGLLDYEISLRLWEEPSNE